MPNQTVWCDPELLLEHAGVRVFHTYKEDDLDQRRLRDEFTLDARCSASDARCDSDLCRHVFYVRELSTWRMPEQPPYCTGEHATPENHAAWDRFWQTEADAIRSAIIAAIERGELTAEGVQPSVQAVANHA